jgi:cytochrome c
LPSPTLTHDPELREETSPGIKRVIPALRRGRPGDGRPQDKPHPRFVQPLSAEPKTLEEQSLAYGVLGGFLYNWIVGQRPAGWVGSEADGAWVRDLAAPDSDYGWQVQIVGATETKRVFRDRFGDDAQYHVQGCTFRCGPRPTASSPGACHSPFEVYAVLAQGNGFELRFTKPLDPRCGWDADSYYIEQWPFQWDGEPVSDMKRGTIFEGTLQPPYRDGIRYPVKSASVSADRKSVFLEIENLKASHVVYIRLLPPCASEDGELPWTTEAWYTLNVIPTDRKGTVLTPPPAEPQNLLTDAERAAGWRLLFDGKTGDGWRGWKEDALPAGWAIENGCLVRVGPGGDICTVDEFGDFALSLEWRISPGGNSGIFFRASEKFDWCWQSAPEMQVLDNAEHVDGRNPLTSAGSNYALHAPTRDATVPVGFFNQARILVRGSDVEHWLNGEKVVSYELGSPEWEQLVANSKFKSMPHYGRAARGHIVLQDHGDRVWYRNIKIRSLD